MNFLHQCRVVHRDLKSLNILLDDNYEPKIADLGLAKFVHDGEIQTMKIGSFPWMAPEVLSSNFYNEKADIYSFAMILYEISTLRYPFGECRPTEIPPKVLSGKRPSLEGVPSEIASLIARCWKQNPRERPSFAEIVADFNDEACLFPDTRRDYFSAFRFKMENADADFRMNLIIAAENNFSELVRGMLENGYDKVNEADAEGRTALHVAIIHGASETVQVLLDYPSVDVNTADARRLTPLHHAVLASREECLRRLTLRTDLAMNPRDRDGNTPLHVAIAQRFDDGIALLLARRETHVNSVNSADDTPLTLAVRNANRLAVLRLSGTGRLKMGIPQHRPLLHHAVSAEDIEMVRLLTIIPGLNVNARMEGSTPLELAVAKDNAMLLMPLLTCPQAELSSPVLCALLAQSIRDGQLCLLRLAIAMRTDVNFASEEIPPAIVTAAAANNLEAVSVLTTAPRLDVNARELASGFTALHYAVQNGNAAMIKCLMGVARVNPRIENIWHQTPKMLTQSRSLRKLLKLPR
jgi:ankyrin repeat protein